MLTTPHTLVGSAIAVTIPNPFISIPLAVGSHFVMDQIPHWQETLYPYKPTTATYVRVAIDLSLSFLLVIYISSLHQNSAGIIWLTAFASNIPDLDSLLSFIPSIVNNKIFKKYWDWHCRIQNETSSLLGLIPQVFISLISVYFIR